MIFATSSPLAWWAASPASSKSRNARRISLWSSFSMTMASVDMRWLLVSRGAGHPADKAIDPDGSLCAVAATASRGDAARQSECGSGPRDEVRQAVPHLGQHRQIRSLGCPELLQLSGARPAPEAPNVLMHKRLVALGWVTRGHAGPCE